MACYEGCQVVDSLGEKLACFRAESGLILTTPAGQKNRRSGALEWLFFVRVQLRE